ncbi:MAG: FAD-dependent thymidylate synthase, partial [Chitinivibrionales bacterium]|nr:FAD-dependent thymidylate synthase [Chitinivibrionales bacterium]
GYQSSDNKQGRANEELPAKLRKKVRAMLAGDQKTVYGHYQELLKDTIARELARINLPLSLYTEMYWQIDLHNLLHFLRLRLDLHAQREIRMYAQVLYKLTRKVCPVTIEAFDNHIMGGCQFSKREMQALHDIFEGKTVALQGREYDLFVEKLGINPSEP